MREIERTADRLLIRTSQRSSGASLELTHEIDVIRQIAIGIQDAIKSSIADWAEIIGAEITTVEKIEELRTKRARLLIETDSTRSQTVGQMNNLAMAESLANLNQQLSDLKNSLPASLQVLEEADDSDNRIDRTMTDLFEELAERDYIELKCFWEPDVGFEKSDRAGADRRGINIYHRRCKSPNWSISRSR